MYVSLNQWLNFFSCKKLSYNEFLKKSKVRRNNGELVQLKVIIKKKKIPSSTLRIFYELFITNKEEYLKNFYNKSLRISD